VPPDNKKLGRGFERISDEDAVQYGSAAATLKSKAETPMEADHQIVRLPVSQITPNPQQPRQNFNEESLDDLVASIKSAGFLQPIVVRRFGEVYQIVAGERRWKAACKLGLSTIPAIVRNVSDEEMLEMALLENIQREDLDPVEKARAFKRLNDDFKLTQDQIAAKVGQKRSTIANYLRLLELPQSILEHVSRGTVTMGHARALLAIDGNIQRVRLCEKIIAQGLSVRAVELEAAVRRGEIPASRKMRGAEQKSSPHIRDLEEALSKTLGSKVRILFNEKTGRGKIIVEFYSTADFERITRAFTPTTA
jgi:ParB family chromosome partitioning protein